MARPLLEAKGAVIWIYREGPRHYRAQQPESESRAIHWKESDRCPRTRKESYSTDRGYESKQG